MECLNYSEDRNWKWEGSCSQELLLNFCKEILFICQLRKYVQQDDHLTLYFMFSHASQTQRSNEFAK